jgi:hypothetical protein
MLNIAYKLYFDPEEGSMSKVDFTYTKYFWDLNEKALKETADILKNPEYVNIWIFRK